MNFPNEWKQVVASWVLHIIERVPKYEAGTPFQISERLLEELNDVGALREIPEPRTMLFCDVHAGYVFVPADYKEYAGTCSVNFERSSDTKQPCNCNFREFREVLE